jgi:hypothetical protein
MAVRAAERAPAGLSRGNTYALQPGRTVEDDDAETLRITTGQEPLADRIRRALEVALAGLGWQPAPPDEATWLVTLSATVENVVQVNDPYYWSFTAEQYEDGTLTLQLLDPQGRGVAWWGSATHRLRTTARAVGLFEKRWAETGEPRDWPVEEMVWAILDELPLEGGG